MDVFRLSVLGPFCEKPERWPLTPRSPRVAPLAPRPDALVECLNACEGEEKPGSASAYRKLRTSKLCYGTYLPVAKHSCHDRMDTMLQHSRRPFHKNRGKVARMDYDQSCGQSQ